MLGLPGRGILNRYGTLHWQPLAEGMNRSDALARLLVDVLGSAFYSIFSS
jgi:hypothetical protein